MGRNDEALYDLSEDDGDAGGRPRTKAVVRCVPDEVEQERARRLRFLEVRHPGEFEEWQRVRPLLNVLIDFWADHEFDFADFLQEVGRRPSENHIVARVDESRPYRQGNMTWALQAPEKPTSPYLSAEQAAAYLGIKLQTLYNNSRHIPSLPGFRNLMYDPKVLDELRSSARFKSQRLGKARTRKTTS